jgi:acetolactate synthase I/II/III large subunit
LKKLSDYVMEFVASAGVDRLFMLTGGACMHLVDSAGRNSDLDYVCCLHEQACAFAAEAKRQVQEQVRHGLGLPNSVILLCGPTEMRRKAG